MRWIKMGRKIDPICRPENAGESDDFNSPIEDMFTTSGAIAVKNRVQASLDEDASDVAVSIRRLEDKDDPTVPFSELRKELEM
jgi:hypothetical protein